MITVFFFAWQKDRWKKKLEESSLDYKTFYRAKRKLQYGQTLTYIYTKILK